MVWIALCFGIGLLAPAQEAPLPRTQPPLTTTESIQTLSNAEAEHEYPIRLEGVVTFSQQTWGILFIEDATGGIFCTPNRAITMPPPGRRVRIEGTTAGGSFLPIATVVSMVDLGPGSMPTPRAVTSQELQLGKYDADFVALRGRVAIAKASSDPRPKTDLEIVCDGQMITAHVFGDLGIPVDTLPCAEVAIQGVFAPITSQQGGIEKISIVAAGTNQIQILQSAAEVLPTLKLVEISSFWESRHVASNEIVRVKGTIHWRGSNEVHLLNDRNGIRLRTPYPLNVAVNETLEVAAVPDFTSPETQLIFLKQLSIGSEAPIKASRVGYHDLLHRENYGQLVELDAEFLHHSLTESGHVLVMRSGEHSFEVELKFPHEEEPQGLETGMQLRVIGMAEVLTGTTGQTPSIRLVATSPNDIRILRAPPWPIETTLSVVVALSILLGLGVIGLGFAYRRLRVFAQRAERAEDELIQLNDDLERRIQTRTEQLAASEARFRTLVEGTDVMLWENDAPNHCCRYISPQAARLGFPLTSWFDPNFWEQHLHPDDRAWAVKRCREEISTGRNFRMQYRFFNAQGRMLWIQDSVLIETRPDGSRVARGVMIDITERLLAEETLRRNETMLRETERSLRENNLFLEQMGEVANIGAWSFDVDTHQITWSDQLYRIHDVPTGAPLQRDEALAFFPAEPRQHLLEALNATVEHQTPFDLRLPLTTAKGRHLWVRVLGQAQLADGRVARVHGSLQDVTTQQQIEDALRVSEERFATAFEYSPALATISAFPGGEYLSVNAEFTNLLGFTREEVIGRTGLSLGIWGEPSQREEFFRTLERGEVIRGAEFLLRSKSGQRHTVLGSLVRVEIDGRACLLTIANDITRRKRIDTAMRSLISTTSQYSGPDFFGHLAQCLTQIFGTKGCIISALDTANPNLLNTLGISLDGQIVPNFQLPAPNTPCAVAINEGIAHFPQKLRERYPDNTLVQSLQVESYLGIAIQDAKRNTLGVIGILDTVPLQPSPEIEPILRLFSEAAGAGLQRMRSLAALQSAEARFRSAIEHSFETVLMADASGICTYVSPSIERLVGLRPVDLLGSYVANLVHPDDLDTVRAHWRQLRGGPGKHAEIEFRVLHKDGTTRWLQASESNRLEDPDLRCIVSNLRDITGAKEAEAERQALELQLRQSQKMEAIGTLAGGIAHDFNNILGVILGNCELGILDAKGNEPILDCLKQILTAGNRAKELVRQILTFSRREDFQRVPIRCDQILTETIHLLRATLPATIDLRSVIHPPIPQIHGNLALLQQVLINLATNAAQAIGNKPGQIEMQLDSVDAGAHADGHSSGIPAGHYVRFRVQDTGGGMAPHILERIFEPFFTTKGPGEGTGLGLSVVHGIVQAHEGFIAVESQPGRGTTFEILLPAIQAPSSPRLTVPTTLPASRRGSSESILLVDDEPALLLVEERALRQAGYTVQACAHPQEALQLMRNSPGKFDLLITDYSMPSITGVDLGEKIRQIRQDLPMLICTGYGAGLTEDRARQVGFSSVLQKPVDFKTLCESVRTALDQHARGAADGSSPNSRR